MRDWEEIIPEYDRKVYEKAGYAGKQPFGQRPALLIIDVITAFTGTKPMETLDAIDEFRSSCGKAAWQALPHIRKLLVACRKSKVPVIYSTSDPAFKAVFGNATKRAQEPTTASELAVQFPQMIRPRKDEYVVHKARASAFFGTHLITLSDAQEHRLADRHRRLHLRLRPLHGHRRLFQRLLDIRGGRRHVRPLTVLAPREPLRDEQQVRDRGDPGGGPGPRRVDASGAAAPGGTAVVSCLTNRLLRLRVDSFAAKAQRPVGATRGFAPKAQRPVGATAVSRPRRNSL